MGETVLQGLIPSSAKLCCVVAKIDFEETRDSSAKSNFHWKTLKCRFILHIMRDSVIACPVYNTPDSIYVITSVEFFKGEVFSKNLREINITWSSPMPVTPDVYSNCLRYSILFAIAPQWNRVGQYLIAGKYFSTQTESNLATRFGLSVNSTNEMKTYALVKIQPLKIKQCYLSLEDIGIPHEVVAHFMADPEGTIDVTSFGNHRVTVMPSLKKGQLLGVFKKIPARNPFKNYGELRRHWKNMYGYRLPESDIGIIYYDVYFAISDTESDNRFLYPHICVRSRLIESPYLGKQEAIIQSFLKDISEAVPMICGEPLKIVKKDDIGKSPISSTDEINSTIRETLEKTPERKGNVGHFDAGTSRFSFSSQSSPKIQQLCRDRSSLMSPTPGMRGNFSSTTATDRLRGILSSVSAGRVRDRISAIRRLPQAMGANNNLPEDQNCCPNVAETENLKAQDCKSTPMETEHSDWESSPQIFMPISSFAASSQNTRKITPFFMPLNIPQKSLSATETRMKPTVENRNTLSTFFDKPSGSNPLTNQSQDSESWGKTTLLQKLRNNLRAKSETTKSNYKDEE